MIWRWADMRGQPYGNAGGRRVSLSIGQRAMHWRTDAVHAGYVRYSRCRLCTRGRLGSRSTRCSCPVHGWAATESPVTWGSRETWVCRTAGIRGRNETCMLRACRISTCFHSHPGNPIDVSKVLVCRHKVGTCLHRVGCNPDVVDGNGPPLGLQRRHHSGIAVRSYWSDRYKGHVGTFEEGSELCKVPIEERPLPKAVK